MGTREAVQEVWKFVSAVSATTVEVHATIYDIF